MKTILSEQEDFFKFFEEKHPMRERFESMSDAEKGVIHMLMEIAFTCGARSGMVLACNAATEFDCPDEVYEKINTHMEMLSQKQVQHLADQSAQEDHGRN